MQTHNVTESSDSWKQTTKIPRKPQETNKQISKQNKDSIII